MMSPSQPNDSDQSKASVLIRELRRGNRDAFDELFPLVYEELRRVAHAQRQRLEGHATLNTTALVHETYLKLSGTADPDWESRAHMLSVAAKAMRQILVDDARMKCATKRGGESARVTLGSLNFEGPGLDLAAGHSDTLIALDASLTRLADVNERHHRIVECRFFGGMTIPDTGVALGLSHRTVERDWAVARVWLYRDMQTSLESSSPP
jgi:RNA polymerase sigma factor (TIGR02999 family)